MNLFYLMVAMFFLGLLAALVGILAAFRLTPASSAQRPSAIRLAVVCILVAMLMYPALFLALRFEIHVVAKGNPGAQAGVLALVIAMGCCVLASMAATLVLITRSR